MIKGEKKRTHRGKVSLHRLDNGSLDMTIKMQATKVKI
jgi:hypothetical protein